MKERYQKPVRNVLLAFVLITIGFALGKEATRRRIAAAMPRTPDPAATEVAAANGQQKVIVYYAHTTFRCVTCNTIESLAKQTLESRFSDELGTGVVEWRVANFQEDERFAKRFEIVSSCVVVVGMKGNDETGFRRLDEVWTKVNDPAAFEKYLGGAIHELLSATEGGSE